MSYAFSWYLDVYWSFLSHPQPSPCRYKCLARPCTPSTCSRAIRLLSHLGHPSDLSSHWRSRSTDPLDPGLSTSPIHVFVLPMHTPTRCLVATWIIELYRHGYELLQLYLAVLGLNLSLRRRSGARTTILVSPASARSPVPPACVLDVLTLSPECPTLPLAYTVHSLEQTCFRCSGTLCSIVAFTGVTVGIRSPSRRRQLCWSSFPALCLTGPFLGRIRVYV